MFVSERHTTKLEDLYIYGYYSDPAYLELLRWPRALKRLYLRQNRFEDFDEYGSEVLKPMLHLQSSSLDEIEYRDFDVNFVLPDLSRFSLLMSLKLGQREFFDQEPRTLIEKSCPPSLEILRIDMEDCLHNGFADYLLEFASCYQELRRTGSLKMIYIYCVWTVRYHPQYNQRLFDRP